MVIDDSFYMRLALDAAWRYQGLTYPNPPVGALLLSPEGKLLSIGAHREAGTAHAELDAVIRALAHDRRLQQISSPSQAHAYLLEHYAGFFKGATLYVTLEPCSHYGATPPCSLLIERLGFSRVVIGTADPNPEATGAIEHLRKIGVELATGVLQEECRALIAPFARWQQKRPFIFFKLATTLNGVISGGTITSRASRTHMHRIRAHTDLIMIGGETVRRDRPRLDCRLAHTSYAPDILIYSTHRDFDRSIPLFSIPGRSVYIEANFDRLASYKNIMIEGGAGMLEATRGITDRYLCYTASECKDAANFRCDLRLHPLFRMSIEGESLSWYAKETP